MKVLSLLILSFYMVACDQPTRTRLVDAENVSPTSNSNIGDNGDNSQPPVVDTPTTPGFEACNLNNQFNGGASIGYFGICQNTTNPNNFKLKMKSTDTSIGTCFVPMHITTNGSSFKVGIPECVHNIAEQEYSMTMTKDRSEAITGMMVIKAGTTLNSFIRCMSAKDDYINSTPNCRYNSQCVDAAANYANYVCGQFVSANKSLYKQINL